VVILFWIKIRIEARSRRTKTKKVYKVKTEHNVIQLRAFLKNAKLFLQLTTSWSWSFAVPAPVPLSHMGKFKTRDAPDTDLAGHPANIKAGYRIYPFSKFETFQKKIFTCNVFKKIQNNYIVIVKRLAGYPAGYPAI
jgi:hypothetical protein